ncbi:hypothetical protein QTP88_017978 [Uroleucon formosanum]
MTKKTRAAIKSSSSSSSSPAATDYAKSPSAPLEAEHYVCVCARVWHLLRAAPAPGQWRAARETAAGETVFRAFGLPVDHSTDRVEQQLLTLRFTQTSRTTQNDNNYGLYC